MKAQILKFIIALSLMVPLNAGAQEELPAPAIDRTDYHFAVGLRAGGTSGLTLKQFIGPHSALEGIVGVWYRGLSFTLLYERYSPAFDMSGMRWYYGIGGHGRIQTGGYYYYRYRDDIFVERYQSGEFGLGVDGIFGLEYKIPRAPIAVSLDVKPYFEIISDGGFWVSLDPGLGIKLAL